MKRFIWRLQRVLDIKIKEEQIKRTQLLEITQKLTQAQGELFMQKRILADTINSLSDEHPKKRLDRQELFLKCSAVNDELIRMLEKKVKEIEKQQKDKISEVLKVKQFRKSLERMREETKMQFIKDQEKIEQKDADEMSTMCFSRKIMEQSPIKEMSL